MPAQPMTAVTALTLTLTNADTQYTLTIPKGTKHFSFRARGGTAFRWATATGKVAGPTESYLTGPYTSPGTMEVVAADIILYFASAVAGSVIECAYWT